jgi:hypothetical protein
MRTRDAGWTVAMVVVMASTALAEHAPRDTQTGLTVCLTVSRALEQETSLKPAILSEVNRIWAPMGISVASTDQFENGCDRWILVKSALEAAPEETASPRAIAWVPFVEKRARRVVFVRMSHARALVEAFNPKNMIRPPAQTDAQVAKLVGRSLAHELGHVLLNSLDHEKSGLMRARYGANDAFAGLPSDYTLNARQLDRLFTAR